MNPGTRAWPHAARLARWACLMMASAAPLALSAQAPAEALRYTVVGDGIPAMLSGAPGDAARGRGIVTSRQSGLCLLCHSGPFSEEPFQGTLAPSLAGAGGRWTDAQLRLRLVDSRRLNPDSIMPAYFRTDHHARVGPAWRGQPVLNAQQIEDVIALLRTLRD